MKKEKKTSIIDFHNHLIIPDTEGKLLLEEMKNNNVEMSLLMGVNKEYTKSAPHIGTNEQVLHLITKYSEKLIGGFQINPLNMEEAFDLLKKYSDYGFKVVKMFPMLGFYPDEERLYPIYEKIQELGMMVLFHMGGSTRSSKVPINISCKYGRPQYVDGLAFRFPEIDFIMAHMGGSEYDCERAMFMAANHANIYLDCSCGIYHCVFKRLKAMEEYSFRPINFKKILWGLDGNPQAYARLIRETQELMIELGWQEHISDVFYNNAHRLLSK